MSGSRALSQAPKLVPALGPGPRGATLCSKAPAGTLLHRAYRTLQVAFRAPRCVLDRYLLADSCVMHHFRASCRRVFILNSPLSSIESTGIHPQFIIVRHRVGGHSSLIHRCQSIVSAAARRSGTGENHPLLVKPKKSISFEKVYLSEGASCYLRVNYGIII